MIYRITITPQLVIQLVILLSILVHAKCLTTILKERKLLRDGQDNVKKNREMRILQAYYEYTEQE